MKAKLIECIAFLSGPLGKNFYASRCPNEPGYAIIKRKPGPRRRKGKRGQRWVMPPAQAAGVESFRSRQNLASQQYADPVLRAQWQQRYDAWILSEHKRGRQGNMLHGKHVRYLWDYVRICLTSNPQ